MDKRREDSQHGMQTVSGGRKSIGGGVQKEDDGVGSDLPGTVEGEGRVRGMQGAHDATC